MKFLPILTAIFTLAATQAQAQNFWIPAERFEEHTNRALEGVHTLDSDFEFREVVILENGEQVRIVLGEDPELEAFIEANPNFQICAFMANETPGQTNTVIVKHKNFPESQRFTLENENYQNRCSNVATLNEDRVLASGMRVLSPSQGAVKLRGVSFRPAEPAEPEALTVEERIANYEESRALGYLFADGNREEDRNRNVIPDSDILTFQRENSRGRTRLGRHFESVWTAFFGAPEIDGRLFEVTLETGTPQDFLLNGPDRVADPKAFLASIVETEADQENGNGKLFDDPNTSRCLYVRDFVNDLNPVCEANTCTGSSCAVDNCAYIQGSNAAGVPPSGFCNVFLSGNENSWTSFFADPNYNFIQCGRVPGIEGMCTVNDTDSRPAFGE